MNKKWRRPVLLLLISIVGGLLTVVLFSTKETSYQCEGQFDGKGARETIYFKLTEYRWWVLWADNDGLLDIEVPSRARHGGTFFIKRIGDQVQLFAFDNRLRGRFSFLTNHAAFWLDPDYEGTCRRVGEAIE